MAEEIKLSGPVEFEPNTDAAVAYWLMEKIQNQETSDNEHAKPTREYFLKLYEVCLRAVKGRQISRKAYHTPEMISPDSHIPSS